MKDNRLLPKPCTKPDCDCIDHAEKKAGGPVKSYPCLADEPDWDRKKSALIGERSAEECLWKALKDVDMEYNPDSYREVLMEESVEGDLIRACLKAMEEYASQLKAKEEVLPEAIDDGLCNNLLGWLNERVKLASYEQGYVLFALRQANNNGYQEAKKVESKEDNKAWKDSYEEGEAG